MAHGVRARAAVAGRGGDEHAGIGGVKEGQRGRFAPGLGAAADRVVDDVDAVGHRLVDRGHGGHVRAQALAGGGVGVAGVVGNDVGARRHAAVGGARTHEGIAHRDAGDVGAVAIGVHGVGGVACHVKPGERQGADGCDDNKNQ